MSWKTRLSRWRGGVDRCSHFRLGVLVVSAAVLLRGAHGVVNLESYSADPDAYRAIARTLAVDGVFGLTDADGIPHPTAFRPPLYPWLLSKLTIGGNLPNAFVALFHTSLVAVTAYCVFGASQRLLAPPVRRLGGIVASLLVIVDPVLLQQSTAVMTETLAAALASMVIWYWAVRAQPCGSIATSALLAGILTLAFFCRPTFLVWAGMLVIASMMPLSESGKPLSIRVGRGLVMTAILGVSVGCWMARNSRAVGHPVWATTHGGYTLLLGNNPLFYDYLRDTSASTAWDASDFLTAYSHRYDGDPSSEAFWRRSWLPNATITADVTEYEDDRVAYDAARATIRRDPGMFFWSSLVRMGRLWTPFPHRTGQRSGFAVTVVGIYFLLFYSAVAVGLVRLGRKLLHPAWWPIPMLVVSLTLVHAVYWSNLRMRAPAIPGLAVIAAAGIVRGREAD